MCVPLGDAACCKAIVMQDLQQLDDCVEFLVLGHKVKGDASYSSGPPRFKYEAPGKLATTGAVSGNSDKETDDMFTESSTEGTDAAAAAAAAAAARTGRCTVTSKHGVSFDWLVALGCLNCGAPVELRRDLVAAAEEATAAAAAAAKEGTAAAAALAAEKAVLRCRRCGHDIAPLHSSSESECLIERMESCGYTKPNLSSGGVYMYGSRSSYNFGSEKEEIKLHAKKYVNAADILKLSFLPFKPEVLMRE
ncbi:RNA polymerase, putative [Eimeria mitis]|uniref:RNA polymerase, putative n=1 Tax=Eimeria mitis TaxID=44415 RepID=U6K9D3_9EIME|nr:RNA polymerase, putative [Eimeria mitis]CDJ34554.1 RNA polymerase, putative [Eimeria mitis]